MKKYFLIPILFLIGLVAQAQTHWQPADPPGSSGLTATLTGAVVIDGVEQYSDQLEVGVFHGEECRGANLMSYVDVLDRYLVFLTIYGIEGEEDAFRLYDHVTQMELDVTCDLVYVYHNDNNAGTIFEPYMIDFASNVVYYDIKANADPIEGGTVTGEGTFAMGETATLVAEANTGYNFLFWTEEEEVVFDEPKYSFEVDRARRLVAHFESCVGVGEERSFVVHPNPVSEVLVVENQEPVNSCEVYSLTGELMIALKDCPERIEIPVANLPKGMYLLKIADVSYRFLKR